MSCSKHLKSKVSALLLLCAFSTTSFAQAVALFELDKKHRSLVVNTMAKKLNQEYVFPKVAKKSAVFIRQQLEAGAYASINDGKKFADKLTKDLQSINHDKHMKVWFNPPPPPPPPANASSTNISAINKTMAEAQIHEQQLRKVKQKRRNLEDNFGFYKVERLAGNVGYLDLRYFSGSEKAQSAAVSAMKFLENTDALIIDMRNNRGGNPAMVRFICSYFFAANIHLNSLYWRVPDITEEYWTNDTVIGKRRVDVPIYVLTSDKTFSGAEELSYNFKTQKRATLVGEVTGGGANPGGEVQINEMFSMFMPRGTAINPITKTNWEGVGVIPDVKTTAEQAFDKAYALAKVSADKFKLQDIENKLIQQKKLSSALTKIETLVKTNKAVAATKANQSLEQAISAEVVDEEQINIMGYEYLVDQQNAEMAILLFSFNIKMFPESFNAFDSLGEAYLKQGNKKLALQHYKKSLQLNPANSNAQRMLSQ
jgi:tetratricopeptide (TPR) repeat protein